MTTAYVITKMNLAYPFNAVLIICAIFSIYFVVIITFKLSVLKI
ncbi:hypothetical protein QE380_001728 [Acinetobacter baylyi]|uniref:Uncharacterized protein n=1 Tax=Acinetobacter baylyi TaxID=202950 RepID=A0ABU0UW52_ACIBI|nr:hypothetical protein [Acinetobacter baylyi]MDR6107603.1 hypothetical protein [Acinetobacter baylyi]MDR6185676.1 hypothetical protein [Acinetobacter baylyi]